MEFPDYLVFSLKLNQNSSILETIFKNNTKTTEKLKKMRKMDNILSKVILLLPPSTNAKSEQPLNRQIRQMSKVE